MRIYKIWCSILTITFSVRVLLCHQPCFLFSFTRAKEFLFACEGVSQANHGEQCKGYWKQYGEYKRMHRSCSNNLSVCFGALGKKWQRVSAVCKLVFFLALTQWWHTLWRILSQITYISCKKEMNVYVYFL